jgi:nucleoside-diphosphate-sugar epimerase
VQRALFIGAGDTGARTATLLAERGWQVNAIRRSATHVPPPLTSIRADITDRASLARAHIDRTDVVVVCVAAGRGDERAYRALYVDGVTNVMATLRERAIAPRRLLFVSSTAVYAQHDGEIVDESSPTEPSRFNGAVMVEAEARVAGSGVPEHVCARLGGIYGPGRDRFVERVRRGAEPVGQGIRDAHTNRIHVHDAANALAFLVEHEQPPSVVNVVDDLPAPRSDVVRWIAQEIGVGVADGTHRAAADLPDTIDERRDDKRVSNALLRSLGFTLRYPTYREGYQALLAAG